MALPSPCWQEALPKGAGRGEDWSSPPSTTAHPTAVATILTSQSVEARIVAGMGGRVYGPYTGRYYANRRETDIEHEAEKIAKRLNRKGEKHGGHTEGVPRESSLGPAA